jgi:hypothetical protein
MQGQLVTISERSHFPSVVIWASLWPDRPDDQIRFDIDDERLTWALLGEASDDDNGRRRLLAAGRKLARALMPRALRLAGGQARPGHPDQAVGVVEQAQRHRGQVMGTA